MDSRFFTYITLTLLLCGLAASDRAHPKVKSLSAHTVKYEQERRTEYWMEKAQDTLAQKLQQVQKLRNNAAKNIILFLGDGMSMHTVTATRDFMGDASEQVSFEKFPYVGLSKTYCVNRQVSDSACTSTAYLGAVKGNFGTVGVNAKVTRSDCTTAQNPANYVESMAKWAQDAQKDTGFVTTSRVSHASPAGMFAHTANRNWECDADVRVNGCSSKDNVDITRQLVEWPVGKRLKVIMGGGRANFRDSKLNDEEGQPGWRTDGRDLVADWLKEKSYRNVKAEYVWSKKGLNMVNLNSTEYLLGLFASSHCPYHGDRNRKRSTEADPSLTEMTVAALKLLSKNEHGYFLFVEGARIDMAHHDTYARKALEDTLEFATAIQAARDMTSEDDTLIVVTSDHSHTMTINGYPFRDEVITGLVDKVAGDGLPYTILSYANGPSYNATYTREQGRVELTKKQTEDAGFTYTASVPLDSETHGGDDVAVFASGPYAQYFSGNYEQNNIPAMMARAANIGPFANL